MGPSLGKTWLGIAVVLWGCSSQPLAGTDPLTLDQACRDLQQAGCAALQRCAPENFAAAFADLTGCVSSRTLDCVERRSAPGNTATPEQVKACADATNRLSCDAIVASEFGVATQRDPACVWQGTLPEGEACIASSQCASGTCSFYDRDACGSCVTRADTSCVVDSECLLGSRCLNGQCVAGRTLGAACGGSSLCSPDFTCRAGQCSAFEQAGDPCSSADSGGCAPNLWCNSHTLQCEPSFVVAGTDGCGVSASGSQFLCPAGNVCLPDAQSGTNRCLPAGAEGAPCSYQIECGVGLGCYESSCTRLRAGACAAPGTSANPSYPAQLPSVPQAVSPSQNAVLAAPKLVLVTFADDPRAATFEAYTQALGASEYWRSATSEYGVGALSVLSAIRVQETPALSVTDSDIQAWLSDKLANDARFPANDSLTIYLMVYPPNVSVTFPGPSSSIDRSCLDFGGYHASFLDQRGAPTSYAVIPACHFSDPESATSHELIEAATDPFSDLVTAAFATSVGYGLIDAPHFAWTLPAAGGAELADLCEWQPLATYRDPEVGGSVQRSWSNAAMTSFHQPCVPARPGVYFNSVPHFDDTVSIVTDGRLRRTQGIAIALGESKTLPVDLLSDGPMSGPWRVTAYDLKEYNHEFAFSDEVEPTLRFAFDRQSGFNGDTLQMTITVLKQDSDYRAEPFVLVSRRGRDTNLWLGVVGQP